MYSRTSLLQCSLCVALLFLGFSAHAETLTLQRALQRALQLDPGAGQQAHLANASRFNAIAAGQLPDPVLRFGGMNFPVDTFDRDQEPMTQIKLGIQQMFPPGATLQYRQQEQNLRADALDALREDRLLLVRRETTLAWMERFFAERRHALLQEESIPYEQLLRVVEFRLESGTAAQADLLAVRLAHSRLQDRISQASRRIETAIGVLGRWVGWPDSSSPLAEQVATPALTADDWANIESNMRNHPRLRAARSQVAATDARLAQAREAYGPSWGVDLAYGARHGHNPDGSRRPDFASAMIMVSLPLLPERRQDASFAARQAELSAARDQVRGVQLELRESMAQVRAQLTGIDQQLEGYADHIIPHAEIQAASTLRAYQANHGDFEALLRARLDLQSARIQRLNLQHERQQWLARLGYVSGQPITTITSDEEAGHE